MIDERNLQNSLYNEFAKIGKSLSSPKRVELLDLLIQGPKSVEELAQATEMTVANVSQHLRTLYHSRMVTTHKEGNYVIYSIKDQEVANFLSSLYSLSENQFMEVQLIKEEFLKNNSGVEGISLSELDKWMEEKDVLLLDVRPKTEYENNHIPGAQSMPVDQLEENLSSLPKNREIVVYCRGTYCLLSTEAVNVLEESGYEAVRLPHSVHEWQQYKEQK